MRRIVLIALLAAAAPFRAAAETPPPAEAPDPVEAAIRARLGDNLDEISLVPGAAFAAETETFLGQVASFAEDFFGADKEVSRAARRLPGALRRSGLLAVAGAGRGEWAPGDGSVFSTSFWHEGGATNPTLPGLLATWPEPVLAEDSPYAHSLADELPAHSLLGWTSSLDPRELWRVARALVPEVAPECAAAVDAALDKVKTAFGFDADAVAASLRPGVLFALAVDTNRLVGIADFPGKAPAPGALFGVRAADSTAFDALARLLPALGVRVKTDEYGIAHCLDVVLPTNAPAWIAPRIEWLPDEGLLIVQSHPAITTAGDHLAAADNDAFWDYARPLGREGDLAFVSPELLRYCARLLGTEPAPRGADRAPAPPPRNLWFVSRTVRIPGEGVLLRTRSALPPPGPYVPDERLVVPFWFLLRPVPAAPAP
ncbi:MAG: hypothetical protein II839_00890 [Kiritimatiellae bacterium]|nr:hypothetical protein [Kiritimatiellia bacterium]